MNIAVLVQYKHIYITVEQWVVLSSQNSPRDKFTLCHVIVLAHLYFTMRGDLLGSLPNRSPGANLVVDPSQQVLVCSQTHVHAVLYLMLHLSEATTCTQHHRSSPHGYTHASQQCGY